MNASLIVAFAGTPRIAATILAALLESERHKVAAVYTGRDRPAGRGRRITPSPVKQLAERHGLSVCQPESPEAFDPGDCLRKVDVMAVAAFGMILPEPLLNRPRLGSINVHMSLLPRWRGAAPVQRAIQAGDDTTGITILRMDSGLDTGPILMQKDCPILAQDTAGTLGERLAALGAACLLSTLDALAAGSARATAQDPSLATYARKVTKEEAFVDWSRPAREIARNVRAFNPNPVAHALLDGERIRVWEASASDAAYPRAAPGSLVAASAQGIDVATGKGVLRIHRLQLPGKKPVTALEYANAHARRHPQSSIGR